MPEKIIDREAWFPPITIKTEDCGPLEPDGHNLTLKLAFGAGGCAYLTGREVPYDPSRKDLVQKFRFRVSPDWIADIFDELERLRVPAAPRHEMGCDGGFTELKVGDGGGLAHYRWWSCPPTGWEGLDKFAQKILAVYDELRLLASTRQNAEIPRFVTSMPVVGMSHVENIHALLKGIEVGSPAELVRERDNHYDPQAIAVYLPEDEEGELGPRIGYIPRARNSLLAWMMDNGASFTAKVFDLEADRGCPAMEILIFNDNPEELERTHPEILERNGVESEGNGFEEKCVDCMREDGDIALREVTPEDVREDLMQRLRGYETVVHTNAEDDELYRNLDDGCYTVEVKNPVPGGESLFLEIAGYFTIFFGGWHAHYSPYLMDYERHFVRDFSAILANEMCSVAAYDRSGKWIASATARPPLTREESPRAALRCLDLQPEHLEELKFGGVVKVRFWSPELNFDLSL